MDVAPAMHAWIWRPLGSKIANLFVFNGYCRHADQPRVGWRGADRYTRLQVSRPRSGMASLQSLPPPSSSPQASQRNGDGSVSSADRLAPPVQCGCDANWRVIRALCVSGIHNWHDCYCPPSHADACCAYCAYWVSA